MDFKKKLISRGQYGDMIVKNYFFIFSTRECHAEKVIPGWQALRLAHALRYFCNACQPEGVRSEFGL